MGINRTYLTKLFWRLKQDTVHDGTVQGTVLSKCYCNDIITWGILLKINSPNPSCSNSFLPEHTMVLNSFNTQGVEPLSGGRGQWPFLPGRGPLSGLSCFNYPLKAPGLKLPIPISRKDSKGIFFLSFKFMKMKKQTKSTFIQNWT